jgi:hypothetical protein
MADEDTVLEEAMDNLKEAGQRIRATQSLMRSEGMIEGANYRDLLTRLSTALAMTEAAYLEGQASERSLIPVAPPSTWLTGPEYATLRHLLENTHAGGRGSAGGTTLDLSAKPNRLPRLRDPRGGAVENGFYRLQVGPRKLGQCLA